MTFNKDNNRKCLYPNILILASRYDTSCDYVISRLIKSNNKYFRLNNEDLSSFSIQLDPLEPRLNLEGHGIRVSVSTSKLNSIWYRRPVFIRETNIHNYSSQQLFQRTQWMEFTRGLMVFSECRWMNHPVSTYRAENKIIQLKTAKEIGFQIPKTIITNEYNYILKYYPDLNKIVVKGLDSVHIKMGNSEIFGYTNTVKRSELEDSDISTAPTIVQEFLENKLDLRVTVVSGEIFCAAIKESGRPVQGDWRINKENVTFEEYYLPTAIKDNCIEITKSLGLSFGAIDLAFQNNEYYFLEINPTGEWGWLIEKVGFSIDESIFRFLTC